MPNATDVDASAVDGAGSAGVDPWRWVRRGLALGALAIGWSFIAWQNRFHITAPFAFVCLGYLAVVSTIYFLWRTGTAAAGGVDDDRASWGRPMGARDELDREKRTLLKAIKEAEFDLEMGKLSQIDAKQMISGYRARAIAVIKELDRLDGVEGDAAAREAEVGGSGGESVREQIEREVKARAAVEAQAKAAKQKAKGGKKGAAATATTSKSKPAEKIEEPAAVERIEKIDEPVATEVVAEAATEPPAVAEATETAAEAATEAVS